MLPQSWEMKYCFALPGFRFAGDQQVLLPLFPPLSPVGNRGLSNSCILEAQNVFDFPGLQLEGKLPGDESCLQLQPHLI